MGIVGSISMGRIVWEVSILYAKFRPSWWVCQPTSRCNIVF